MEDGMAIRDVKILSWLMLCFLQIECFNDIQMMSRAIYSRWYCGHVCAGFCKSTLGTREFCEMAFQKSRNFISEFWWDPWTKLSYIEMVVMTQNKISPGIVINHVDRSFHVLIVTTGDISMIPSFEIWSYMLLELLSCWNLCWIKPQK